MALPDPRRDFDHADPPRGNWWLVLLLIVALALAVYWQRASIWESADQAAPAGDLERYRGNVSCWTALDCAAVMAASWQTELPLDTEASVLESVTASGGTVTFVLRLKYDRAVHEAGQYPDGKTWEQHQAEFAAVACDEYDHRPLIELGGRVVHRTIFADGELLSELVIDSCEPEVN